MNVSFTISEIINAAKEKRDLEQRLNSLKSKISDLVNINRYNSKITNAGGNNMMISTNIITEVLAKLIPTLLEIDIQDEIIYKILDTFGINQNMIVTYNTNNDLWKQ